MSDLKILSISTALNSEYCSHLIDMSQVAELDIEICVLEQGPRDDSLIPNSNTFATLWILKAVAILGGILAVDKQLAVDQIVAREQQTVDKIEDRGQLMRQSPFEGR